MSDKNRLRNEQVKIRLTKEEHDKFYEKFRLSGENSLREFVYNIVMKGHIVKIDLSEILEVTSSINKIGTNINQIVKNANITQTISEKNINQIENLLSEVNNKQDIIMSLIFKNN
jgi:possible pcfF